MKLTHIKLGTDRVCFLFDYEDIPYYLPRLEKMLLRWNDRNLVRVRMIHVTSGGCIFLYNDDELLAGRMHEPTSQRRLERMSRKIRRLAKRLEKRIEKWTK